MGRATRAATVSGYIWPKRLGTSSPKMMLRMVMITTTTAVEATSMASTDTVGICAWNHADSGPENAASPTMPLSTPMDVMPICTVERNLVGLSCSVMAACAPPLPASIIT